MVFVGTLLRDPQGHAVGDDGHLVNLVRLGRQPGHEGVAAFVVGDYPSCLRVEGQGALVAQDDLVQCALEVALHDGLVTAPGGPINSTPRGMRAPRL